MLDTGYKDELALREGNAQTKYAREGRMARDR